MRCFACNRQLETATLDKPTDRYYCGKCFEWTIREIMSLRNKSDVEYYDLDTDIYTEEELEHQDKPEREDWENHDT